MLISLKHAPAVSVPLVRQLVILTKVAFWAGYHKIARVVGSASRQRDYMIDVIFFAHLLITPVATAFLSRVLNLNIFCGMTSAVLKLQCATTVCVTPIRQTSVQSFVISLALQTKHLGILSGIFSGSLTTLHRMTLIVLPSLFSATPAISFSPLRDAFIAFYAMCISILGSTFFSPVWMIVDISFLGLRYQVWVVFGVLPIAFIYLVFMRLIIGASFDMTASRAYWSKSVFAGLSPIKLRVQKIVFAVCAALKHDGDVQHSVSLSLYLIWALADGEIRRLFGSYPSQHLNYSTGWGKTL
jgi:hypothetical protein